MIDLGFLTIDIKNINYEIDGHIICEGSDGILQIQNSELFILDTNMEDDNIYHIRNITKVEEIMSATAKGLNIQVNNNNYFLKIIDDENIELKKDDEDPLTFQLNEENYKPTDLIFDISQGRYPARARAGKKKNKSKK